MSNDTVTLNMLQHNNYYTQLSGMDPTDYCNATANCNNRKLFICRTKI